MNGGEYRDETRVIHMLEALNRLAEESKDVNGVDNLSAADRLTRAIIYDFIVLGEAANNVSENFCAKHSDVPWREIAGFRHKLVHDYSSINFEVMFDALKVDVPNLLPKIQKVVEELPAEPALPPNIGDFK